MAITPSLNASSRPLPIPGSVYCSKLRLQMTAASGGGPSTLGMPVVDAAHGLWFSSTGQGTASRVVANFGSGLATARPIALDQAPLTRSALLDEAGGTGELAHGEGGAALLPLMLTARSGSKPTDAIFQARPSVRVELKSCGTGVIEYRIEVNRATIPARRCCARRCCRAGI
jgi:hypothetical protein